MIFQNREQAGKMLGEQLRYSSLEQPIIVGLPRGGIPVAYEVAKIFRTSLEVLIVRKISTLFNKEYGIGAITEENYFWIDRIAELETGVSEFELQNAIRLENFEVNKRIKLYRRGLPLIEVTGRTVIIVDDGLATGVTARVACEYLRQKGAKILIIAVPVGARFSVESLSEIADQVVCLNVPHPFYAVGNHYQDFQQLRDEDVLRYLDQRKEECEEEMKAKESLGYSRQVELRDNKTFLRGSLTVPYQLKGFVIFAHGSGSSYLSLRNKKVAEYLSKNQLGTLLFDLLSPDEAKDRNNVFNIPFLSDRLINAMKWSKNQSFGKNIPIGFFGSSTGAAAALWAAAELGDEIAAIVSRGGRPDLAMNRLKAVTAPTLLLVGSFDETVLKCNEIALNKLRSGNLVIIPGATHLFEESGAMESVSSHATEWFKLHFKNKRLLHAA